MAARKKKPSKQPTAGAHDFAVVTEELRGQFKVFGEALQGFRDHVDRRFEQIDQRFDRVDRRFDRVDQEMGLLKSAVLEHGRELKEIRAGLEKKVDRNEVEALVERAVAGSRSH
jgi:hypothetical protein